MLHTEARKVLANRLGGKLPWEKFGGFVAGGCARKLATIENELKFDVDGYLGETYRHDTINTISSNGINAAKVGRGDVDIFFTDQSKAAAFVDYAIQLWKQQPVITVTGAAKQFVVMKSAYCTTLQVITARFANEQTVESILSTFDICNVKVALTADGFVYTDVDEFNELEAARILKVAKWDRFTAQRVIKMLCRQNLSIHSEDREQLLNYILHVHRSSNVYGDLKKISAGKPFVERALYRQLAEEHAAGKNDFELYEAYAEVVKHDN